VWTGATPDKICEISAVVVDLPLLPVTAMKVARLRLLEGERLPIFEPENFCDEVGQAGAAWTRLLCEGCI
jgi:hypothetical protein